MPVVNAHLYLVTPTAAAAWHDVLSWALLPGDLDWPFVEHVAAASLASLWARDDLDLALMDGLAFAQRERRPTLIATPVPSPARYAGRPMRVADLVVAASSLHGTLEDDIGGMTGDLVEARDVIEALSADRIDIGALDSYAHDLLRAGDPALARQVRTVGRSAPLPIPPRVATAPIGVSRHRPAARDPARGPRDAGAARRDGTSPGGALHRSRPDRRRAARPDGARRPSALRASPTMTSPTA